jgi:hypothetical protein
MSSKSKSFLLIDGTTCLNGIAFSMAGGRMDRFRANPVMLYMHLRGNAIGRWENIRQEGDGWMADPVFDTDDAEAARIAGKVERGFLKACSIGVAIHAVEEIGDQIVATDWEPYEGSIVDAGSNANALTLYSTSGEMIKDTQAHIKHLTLSIMEKTPISAAEAAKTLHLKLAVGVGLAETATAEEVEKKVLTLAAGHATLTKEKTELEAQVTALELAARTAKTSQIKDLLDQALNDKKIDATERMHYEKLAAVDFDTVRAIVGKMAPPVDLVKLASQGSLTVAGDQDDELAKEYRNLDKAGKLVKLRATDPQKFNTLYKARFGKEYQE